MLPLIVNFKVCANVLLVFVFWRCFPLGFCHVNLINVCPLSVWMPQIFVFVFAFREQLWKKRNGHGIAGHLPAWLNKFIAHWQRRLLQNAANVAQLPVQSVCVSVCLPYNWHSKRGKDSGGMVGRGGGEGQAISFMNSYVSYRYNERRREYMACIDSAALP